MKKMKQILLILLLMISLMFLYMLFSDNIETFSDYEDTDSSDNDISNNDLSGNDLSGNNFKDYFNRDENSKKDDTNGKKDDTADDNDKNSDPKPNDPYEKYFNQQSLIEEQGRFIDQQQDFIDIQNQNKNSNNNNPRNTCVNYLPSHYGEFQSDIQIGIIKLDTYWKFTTNPGVNAEYFPIIACQQPPITHAYENGSEYGYDAATPWSTIVQHSIIVGYPVPNVPC